MSHKSRIRKPVRADIHHDVVKDVIGNKMANILKPKAQTDMDRLNEKLKHTLTEVKDSMKPVLEAAGALSNHEANRSILASLLLERFDKYDHDELVNTITMILTEEILNNL